MISLHAICGGCDAMEAGCLRLSAVCLGSTQAVIAARRHKELQLREGRVKKIEKQTQKKENPSPRATAHKNMAFKLAGGKKGKEIHCSQQQQFCYPAALFLEGKKLVSFFPFLYLRREMGSC